MKDKNIHSAYYVPIIIKLVLLFFFANISGAEFMMGFLDGS